MALNPARIPPDASPTPEPADALQRLRTYQEPGVTRMATLPGLRETHLTPGKPRMTEDTESGGAPTAPRESVARIGESSVGLATRVRCANVSLAWPHDTCLQGGP